LSLPAQKSFLKGEETGVTKNNYSELRTREEIQEENNLPFLSLELQVTIIKASTCKILVA